MTHAKDIWNSCCRKQPLCLIKLWRSCEFISQTEKITDKTKGRINATLGGYFSLPVCDWQDPDSAPHLIKKHHIIPAVSQYLNINTVASPHPSLPDRHSPLMSFITMMKQWMEGRRDRWKELEPRCKGAGTAELQQTWMLFCLPIKRTAQLWLAQKCKVRKPRQRSFSSAINQASGTNTHNWGAESFQGYNNLVVTRLGLHSGKGITSSLESPLM